MLSVEAYVGGYFGTSYEAFIDLQNKVGIYRIFEEGNQIIDDKEISIDNAMIDKFRADINSIGVLDWDKEYIAEALDGTSWSVIIKTTDGVFKSSGSNAFPKNWRKFSKSVEGIVKGTFR